MGILSFSNLIIPGMRFRGKRYGDVGSIALGREGKEFHTESTEKTLEDTEKIPRDLQSKREDLRGFCLNRLSRGFTGSL
jgi:hypothetical protein